MEYQRPKNHILHKPGRDLLSKEFNYFKQEVSSSGLIFSVAK
jgi:hypothetical protein